MHKVKKECITEAQYEESDRICIILFNAGNLVIYDSSQCFCRDTGYDCLPAFKL